MDKGSRLMVRLNRKQLTVATTAQLPIVLLCLSLPAYLMVDSVIGTLQVLRLPDYIIAEGVAIPRAGATPVTSIALLEFQGFLALAINAVAAFVVVGALVLFLRHPIKGLIRGYNPLFIFDERGVTWITDLHELFFPWDYIENITVIERPLWKVLQIRTNSESRWKELETRITTPDWPEFWLQESNGREVRLTQSEFESSLDKLNVRKAL